MASMISFASQKRFHLQDGAKSGKIPKKTIKDFPIKQLDEKTLGKLLAFEKKCVEFKYSEENFRALAREMVAMFSEIRGQNDKFKLYFIESGIIEGKYMTSFELVISNSKDGGGSYAITLGLQQWHDRLYLTHKHSMPGVHTGESSDLPNGRMFAKKLKSVAMELKNFDVRDIGTSPAFLESVLAYAEGR